MNEQELQKLYAAMSKEFDIGSYDDFKAKMQTTPDRQKFYNAITKEGYDLGDYNSYESRLAGEKKNSVGSQNGSIPAVDITQGGTNPKPFKSVFDFTDNTPPTIAEKQPVSTTPQTVQRSEIFGRRKQSPNAKFNTPSDYDPELDQTNFKFNPQKYQQVIKGNLENGTPLPNQLVRPNLYKGAGFETSALNPDAEAPKVKAKRESIENTVNKKLAQMGITPNDTRYESTKDELTSTYKKGLENGEVSIGQDDNGQYGLRKNLGTFESYKDTYNKERNAGFEATNFQKLTPEEKVNYAPTPDDNGEFLSPKHDVIGSFIGGTQAQLEKPIAGTIAATALTGTGQVEGLPTVAGIAFSSKDAYNRAYMNEYQRVLPIIKQQHPDWNAEQLDKEADKQATIGGGLGMASNAILFGGSTGVGSKLANTILDKSAADVIGKAITGTAKMAGVPAISQAATEEIGNLNGIKTDQSKILDDAIETYKSNLTPALVFHALGAAKEMPEAVRNAYKYAVKDIPPLEIRTELKGQEDAGLIPKGSADQVASEIQSFKEATDKIPDHIEPEKQVEIAPLIEKKNQIAEEQKLKDDSFKEGYKGQLEEINNQINGIINPEQQTLEQGLQKARKVFNIPEDDNSKDEDLLKEVAQQAQNIDANGQPHETGTPEQSKETAIKNFGQPLVDHAIEKYPAEPVKPTEEIKNTIQPVSPVIQPNDAYRTLDYGDMKGQEETPEKQKEIENDIIAGNKPLGNTGDTFDQFRDEGLKTIVNDVKNDPHNTIVVTHSSFLKLLKVWEDMGRPDIEKMTDEQKKEFNEKYVKESTNKGEVVPVDTDNGKLYFVRHGETEDNQASEFRTPETQLTDKGRQQAEKAGQEIASQIDGQASQIKTSDLDRAIETSNIIHDQLESKKEPTRQEKINQLIDDNRRFNDRSKTRTNSTDWKTLRKDLQARAEELGVKFKMNGTAGSVLDANGNPLKKVNSTKNSTLAKDFNPKNYSEDTHNFIDKTLTEDNWHNLPPIEGVDGKTMSLSQTEKAVKDIKQGKITNGAKAVYDAVEKIFREDNADYSDKRLNFEQTEKMSASEFVKQFEKPTVEASDEDIQSLNEIMGDEAFEKYFNELKQQEDEYHNQTATPAEPEPKANGVQGGIENPELNDQEKSVEHQEGNVGETNPVQEPVAKDGTTEDNDNGSEPPTSEQDLPGKTIAKRLEIIKDARTNSYRFFKEKYPDISNEEYNQLRSQKIVANKSFDLFLTDFWEHDVEPRLINLFGGTKETLKGIVNVLSPKTGVSEKAITKIAGALGDRNEASTMVDKALGTYEKAFDKMPDSERIAFIDRLKKGEKQPSPQLQEIADALRTLDTQLYEAIKEYKPSISWKEDHYRVLWKKIPGAEKETVWSSLARRPLRGSMGFLKQATLADMSEGIDKGGVPHSTNPITMFKMAYADGMKFVTAQRMFEGLKKDGMVKFVKNGERAPDDFVHLNDRLAKVYFKTPEGLVNTGEYYVQEGAARLLNNYLSRDFIRETKAGRGLMALKNLYTQIELGLSGFHAIAESLETISSDIGLGLRKIINLGLKGDLKSAAQGAGDIVKSITAPGTTYSMGRAAIKFATEKGFEESDFGKKFLERVPDAKQYVHDLFQGGGLLKQNDEWKANTFKALKEHAGKDNYIGATLRALPALNESLMSPLFNHYIPALKAGMFFKEFPVVLKENEAKLNSGEVTREQLARKTVNFIDDRLGEMNFDNLYWNRTFKTAMQFMFRSVTWKLGNIRAMGGAVPEQAMEFYHAIQEKRAPLLMPKMGWLLGLSVMQVALASTIQHLFAHKPLTSIKDIVAPQINEDNEDERVVLPTYYKDMMHAWHKPGEYLTSSAAGQLSRFVDVWNNKNFYGYEIYDPHGKITDKAKDIAEYVAPKPFSISSASQMIDKGEPASKVAMSFIGLQAAPAYLKQTGIESEIMDLWQLRNAGTKPKAEEESNAAKREILKLYQSGEREQANEKLKEAYTNGLLRPTQIRNLFSHSRTDATPAESKFKELPFEDKVYLYDKMSDEEKKQFDSRGTLERQIKSTHK